MPAEIGATTAVLASDRGLGRVFLVADDLTGALDAAARFAVAGAPVEVRWRGGASADGGSLALDSGTREIDAAAARATVAALLAGRPRDPSILCYAKLDSLLRGNAAAEIAAWIEALRPVRCVIAPAFPYQNRVTRGGRQYVQTDGAWHLAASDLRADLAALGFAPLLRRPGDSVPDGVSFWDAETDADLALIAAAGGSARGLTLWCGSGGLASALAAGRPVAAPDPWGKGAVLGLFGTDHPVTAGQVDACGDLVLAIDADETAAASTVAARLAGDGVVLVRPALPAGVDRRTAADLIERRFASLVSRIDPPGTLIVAGGETLRGLCRAIGADHLDLHGEIVPGVAASIVVGGRFDGVRVVSKSGAFGDPDLLRRLVAERHRSALPIVRGTVA